MTRRIEILAYINSHPGSRASDIRKFFGAKELSWALNRLWNDNLIKRDFENSSFKMGWSYYITEAGRKYLKDKWDEIMPETDISIYKDRLKRRQI